MTKGLLIYGQIFAHFLIYFLICISKSPSSYMALQPVLSEFPYIQYEENFVFF
jgi:hypothetical protein